MALVALLCSGIAIAQPTDQSSEFGAALKDMSIEMEHPKLLLDDETIPSEIVIEDLGVGIASYYGKRFAGRPTASGEPFDPMELTAAHRTLPFGSRVKVTNRRNGKSVVVRINDRGPFSRDRDIDLSRMAAERIGLVQQGHGPVQLFLLDEG